MEILKLDRYESLIHDMKTPLAIAYTYLQVLEKQVELTVESHGYISKIKRNWMKLFKLVNDSCDYDKMEKGFLEPKYENYDIVQLTSEIAENVKPLAARKRITVAFRSRMTEKVTAVDKNMFERIMLNLLSNAVKFTNEAGKVEIVLADERDYISITVRDNGVGMSAKAIKTVLEGDTITDAPVTADAGGAIDTDGLESGKGMGLFIVKKLTELMHGRLEISSGNRGTSVKVTLPALLHEATVCERILRDSFFSENIVQIELSDL